jgi:ribonuclease HI
MKYRIIYEADGNGKGHYEAEILKKHWYGNRWESIRVYRNSGFNDYYSTNKYTTFEEAMNDVRSRKIERTVTHQGEL